MYSISNSVVIKMSDEHDELKRELQEIRELRKSLREELEDLRREKEQIRRIREESILREEGPPRRPRPPPDSHPRRHAPPPHPRPPPPRRGCSPHPHRTSTVIDFEELAESLEEMMEGLGEQIRMAVSSIRPPSVIVHPSRPRSVRSSRRKSRRLREIKSITPDRIARVVSPLGNVERLRILDFLKDGGKSFNELESHIGKTGSSLTHHLAPLLEAGYIIKGAVRGTYYVTVTGRLAYRLAQWLTGQVEREMRLDSSEENVPSEDMDDSLEDEDLDDEFELSPDDEEVE